MRTHLAGTNARYGASAGQTRLASDTDAIAYAAINPVLPGVIASRKCSISIAAGKIAVVERKAGARLVN